MKILVIENDQKLAAKLGRLLTKNHFEPFSVKQTEGGLDEAISKIYDAVIFDIDLPGGNGLNVLKQLRRSGLSVPVLALSPKCGVMEKVRGLDAGADDFLEKPFADAELVARLRAVSRRKGEFILDNKLSFSGLILDLNTYTLSNDEKEIQLSKKEFEMMKYFFLYGSNIVNKEIFLTQLWKSENAASENNLDVYISYLRKKLKQIDSKIQIRCIKNVGYYLMNTEEGSPL